MASYDEELLLAARLLLVRRSGLRGKLPSARVRRSISTTYYALFHFILDEVGQRVIGTGNDLRVRRRALARTVSHRAIKTAMDKVRGNAVDTSIADFMRVGPGVGPVVAPAFARNLANVFTDAQAKRHDADYDLNRVLSEADARALRARVRRTIKHWRTARSKPDRDAKHAICALVLLKGQLRPDS